MSTTAIEPERDTSLTHLVGGIISDTEELLKQQINLVKVEVKNDVQGYVNAAIPMVIAAAAAGVGAFVLAFAVAHLLVYMWPALHVWGAYAIVGGILTVGGALVVMKFANQFAAVKLLDQTAAGVKENMQWKTNS